MTKVPPPPPPPPQPRLLAGLTCASCGGTITVQEGWTNVACQYCETPLAVIGDRGVTRLMVLDEIDRTRGEQELRRWLGAGIRKAPSLQREARIDEAFLAWFPFVRVRFDVIGWVLGTNKVRRKRGDSWETVNEPVEREVEKAVDRTMPAAQMAEFGVDRVDLKGDTLLPLDEEALRNRGMVFRPSRAVRQVSDEMCHKGLEEIRRRSTLDRVTFSWLTTLRRHLTLVYYPLWVFRYRFRGRTYQVLVDAEDGSLAYGKAPGNHLYRAFALVAAFGGACFIGTSMLQHLGWLLRFDEGWIGIGIGVVLLGALASWGYAQFRHGGVIEEGTGLAAGKGLKSLVDTIKETVEDS